MNIQPYEYTVVLNELPTNLEALVQPFDRMTWIALIFTAFLITVIMQCELKASRPNILGVMKISSACVWLPTFATMIDQPVSNLSQLMKKNTANALIWGQWCIVAVTLSQFYKGGLFSFLSSSPSPEVPNNIEAILRTEMLILTKNSANCYRNSYINLIPCSTLKEMIRNDLLSYNFKNVSFNYTELYRRLEWIGNHYTRSMEQLLGSSNVYTINTNITQNSASLVFIGTPEQVKLFKLQFALFSGKWTSKPVLVSLFMDRDGWIIRENYLHRVFKMMLAQLYESGLYDRWNNFDRKDDIVFSIKQTARAIHKHGVVNGSAELEIKKGKHGFGISLENLFHYVYMNTQKQSSASETLETKVYLLIMLYALFFLVLACAVWIVEVVTWTFISPV
ncbi:unnamed protein product [Orchesella dallaii]|uniref:Ionotropic glutamate receptor C-terminal domain-containing protein n=1 Tax=Orchesella dallaii TaxID=48710 RepID=A0ABP1QN94_9HEXA